MSHVYRRTTREAFLEAGSVMLRASVAAEANDDRVQVRVLRHNRGSQTWDEIWVSPTIIELREFVDVLGEMARENRNGDWNA